MSALYPSPEQPVDTGLEVLELSTDPSFTARQLHTRDLAVQMEGMRRLTHAFVSSPETILQELVNAAIDLCGADSAGISVEQENRTEENYYRWVATAGEFAGFLNATLPHHPSACTLTLERGRPQLFRVTKPFYDLLGVSAPVVTDGLLLPWQADDTRGTIYVVAHGRPEAFDSEDLRLMQVLADFAAMAVRHQSQQKTLLQQASNTAAAAMAHTLAHEINNPLQSLTNVVYLASEGHSAADATALANDLSAPLQRLSGLVSKLLALPYDTLRNR
ncbi:GAF domain-containing protein [Granulicella tundricola]|uniref:GAF domain protein n=1 Tax=Granulicella tundricola (strain ATCC BAA-1859 / DSM 23138 / MP5ACTX9) TaxID=1198114 RepID=E8WWW0_GRATM|nr:GAF domain-containing protein [Granulicella tundricola]ADW67438.1 GAF domain protein [Granulicella tundricola MP5ACTX9]